MWSNNDPYKEVQRSYIRGHVKYYNKVYLYLYTYVWIYTSGNDCPFSLTAGRSLRLRTVHSFKCCSFEIYISNYDSTDVSKTAFYWGVRFHHAHYYSDFTKSRHWTAVTFIWFYPHDMYCMQMGTRQENNIYSSAVITRSSITLHCIRYYSNWART